MSKTIKKLSKKRYNRPEPKQQLTLRLRPDTIEWFRQYDGYHTMISDILDDYVAEMRRTNRKPRLKN